MDCNTFTKYEGLDPNDQTLTAEQKMQACMSYRDYIMNTFVPEMNAAMPQICASGQVKLENYVGEAKTCEEILMLDANYQCPNFGIYDMNHVVSYKGGYYRSLKDDNTFKVFSIGDPLSNIDDWQRLPVFPRHEASTYAASAHASPGTTVTLGMHQVSQKGKYLVIFQITADQRSGSMGRKYESKGNQIYIYGSTYDTGTLTFVADYNKDEIVVLSVQGANNQDNYMYRATLTMIQIQ